MVISIALNERALAVSGSSSHYKEVRNRDFPCGPIAKILHSQCRGVPSSIPGQGTRSHMPQLKIPCAKTEKRSHIKDQRS